MAEGAQRSGPPRRGRGLIVGVLRSPVTLTAVLFAVLSSAASLVTSGYVADNRYEVYASPWSVVRRSLRVWDATRGFGAPREDVWLPTVLPSLVLRTLGASPAVTQRLVVAALLTMFGLGVVALVRRLYERRVGAVHVVAGVIAMFGPFTASFVVPSNLFAMSVISVWLTVIVIDGVRGHSPWATAAKAALLVLLAGNADLPGLSYAGVMILPAIAYLVAVERSASIRSTAAWLARALPLVVLCGAWPLAKAWIARDELAGRLAETELPSTSATTSSWSESLRGLGNWLSYFADGGRLAKPHTEIYFTSPLVVIATFALPAVAVATLWKSPWRARLLCAGWMVLGITVMVGGFSSAPAGDLISWSLDSNSVLNSFRNTYKAGGSLAVATAILAAVGIVTAVRAAARTDRRQGVATAIAAAVVVGTTAAPFMLGEMYHPDERAARVPGYWVEATDYLDGLDPRGRTLILPAASQAYYRWGYVGDDIFDAMLDRPHATPTGWMTSTAAAHVVLEQLALAAQEPNHRAGVLGAMLRRTGITEILLRNDLDWRRQGVARPAAFRALRDDPDLELVASFGATVTPLTGAGDDADDRYERSLPAVEVYAVRDSGGDVVVSDGRSLVVAGDAAAWPVLVQSGLMTATTPMSSSASMDDAALRAALADGARLVVTDSARRRVRRLAHHELQLSPTLAATQQLDRPPRVLGVEDVASMSVAWFADAEQIGGAYITFGGYRYDRRPALAFDQDPATMWGVPASPLAGRRPALTVTLRRPTVIESIDFLANVNDRGQAVTRSVRVDAGPEVGTIPVRIDQRGVGRLTLPDVPISRLTFVISGTTTLGPEIGFREIRIAGLDLREYISAPTDLVARLRSLDALDASVSFAFRRSSRPAAGLGDLSGRAESSEETVLARRFIVPKARTFRVAGRLLVDAVDIRRLASGPECRDVGLSVGPTPSANNRIAVRLALPPVVPTRATNSPVDVAFEACGGVALGEGEAFLRTVAGSAVDSVWLVPDNDEVGDPSVPIAVTPRSADVSDLRGSFEADRRVVLTLRQSFHRGWRLTADGATSSPFESGGMTAWRLDPAGRVEYRIFRPADRWLSVTIIVSLLAGAMCLVLVAAGRMRRADDCRAPSGRCTAEGSAGPAVDVARRRLVAGVAATVIGGLIIGPIAVPLGIGIVLAVWRVPAAREFVGLAPVGLIAAATVAVVLRDAPLSIVYPVALRGASDLVALAMAIVVHLIAVESIDTARPGVA